MCDKTRIFLYYKHEIIEILFSVELDLRMGIQLKIIKMIFLIVKPLAAIMRMKKSNALILIHVWTRKINHQKMPNKVDFCLVVTSSREKWYGR